MATYPTEFNKEELLKCSRGELFGPGNAQLPAPPMLMIDRITEISEDSGLDGKGHVVAEFDIAPDLWFFDCHFPDNPIMPGCLGLDALWQLTGFNLGWRGWPGKGYALGVGEVKFTGEVLNNNKLAKYIIEMKRIIKKGETSVGLADGTLLIDDKKIYSTKNLKVGLFKS